MRSALVAVQPVALRRTASLADFIKSASMIVEVTFMLTGRVQQMIHAETDERGLVIRIDAANKDDTSEAARLFFAQQKVRRYVFIDEAWIWQADIGISQEEIDKWMASGLEHHPARKEVVWLHGEDVTVALDAERQIIRPEKGKPSLGELLIHEPAHHSEGRFLGLLPREGTTMQ